MIFTIAMSIDFDSKVIGRQELFLEVSSDNFRHENQPGTHLRLHA